MEHFQVQSLIKCSILMFLCLIQGSLISGQQTKITYAIPDYLLECYNSTYITTKDDLLPMTITMFISLIRKIEDELGYNMDARTIVPAILARFRYDGIERNPLVSPSQFVYPYGTTGNEFLLYQTIFGQFLPPAGIYSIPNDTLSYVERCTLHSMLSSSVDVWDRGDNDKPCGKLSRFSTWGSRVPRGVPEDAEPSGKVMHSGHRESFQQIPQQMMYPESACPVENGVVYDTYGTVAPGIVLAGISAGLNFQRVPFRNLYNEAKTNLKRRPRPDINTRRGYIQGWPYGTDNDRNPGQNIPGFGSSNPGYGQNPGYGSNNPGYGQNPGFGSNNPEYGQSNPGYGQSNPGLGRGSPGFGQGSPGQAPGFGRGNNPGFGRPGSGNNPDYGGSGGYPAGMPVDIDNKYAATLSGLLAYTALLQGPERGRNMNIGSSGGWNDTLVPKYYFLSNYIKDSFTDAKIRGAIDGLLIGDSINDWMNSGTKMKLSQILSMYYSAKGVLSTDIRACSRKSYFERFTSQLTDQTYAVAEVLKYNLRSTVVVQDRAIEDLASTSVELLRTNIPGMAGAPCPTDNNIKTSPVADLHLVLDFSWEYADASRIIQYIIGNCMVQKYGSNITLVNAKTGWITINATDSLSDFSSQFNESFYRQAPIGFDFPKALSQLKLLFRAKLDDDKRISSGGGIPREVIFIPYSSVTMSDSDKDSALSLIRFFHENVPDTKLLYLVNSGKEKFSPFADVPEKDIISLSGGGTMALDQLVKRISQIPRRIIDPTCGRLWIGSWYPEVRVTGALNPGEVHFYRVHPNYFFKDANAKITISTEGMAPTLTVCTSRTNAMPLANLSTTNDVTCQQVTGGNQLIYALKDADCGGVYYAFQCNPFYFSITNTQRAHQTTHIVANCIDPACTDPDMTKYTIAHTGLSCYSSAWKIKTTTGLLVITALVHMLRSIFFK